METVTETIRTTTVNHISYTQLKRCSRCFKLPITINGTDMCSECCHDLTSEAAKYVYRDTGIPISIPIIPINVKNEKLN